MISEMLVRTFFDNNSLECSTSALDYGIAGQKDVFLPVVLAYIKFALKDTSFENSCLACTLLKTTESLTYLKVDKFELFDERLAHHVLKLLGGYQSLQWFENQLDGDIDITLVVEYFREHLKIVPEGEELIDATYLDELFSVVLSKKLDKDRLIKDLEQFIANRTAELKEYEHNIDAPSPVIEHTINEQQIAFTLKNNYLYLDRKLKNFFNEITYIACAKYLSSSPEANIQEINTNNLPIIDIEILLSAIIGTPELLKVLADEFGCQPSQIVMSSIIYKNRELLKDSVGARTLQDSANNTKSWYQLAEKYTTKINIKTDIKSCLSLAFNEKILNLSTFIKALLELKNECVENLSRSNKLVNHTIKSMLVQRNLTEYLNTKITGQQQAIEHLTNGYLTSCISKANGPRLIYTFAGPSGVGKTYLANVFSDYLNECEHSGYAISTFNMEQFNNEKNSARLFGSGSEYTDAGIGILTGTVKAQPRHILIFDEIEKAHSNVIQSLLTLLDSGVTIDQTLSVPVDFTQCIVIFTTNLGQEVLANNAQNRQVNIFDVLRNAENPTTKTKLSIEFINRLSKGYPISFSPLKANHLISLAEKALNSKSDNTAGVQFSWPKSFSSFLLKRLSPEITVRQLTTCVAKLKSEILTKSAASLGEHTTALKYNINVEDKGVPLIAQSILLFDNDNRLQSELSISHADKNIHVMNNSDKISQMLKLHRPDVFLIDIESVDHAVESLNDIINKIHAINSIIPLFSYRIIGGSNVDSVPRDQNIREHFELELSHLDTTFYEMLERINYYLTTEKSLSSMLGRNEKLNYQCQITNQQLENDKQDQEGKIQNLSVLFHQLSVNQVIESKDMQETSFFNQSLPTEKLDDVIGLQRAKKRLLDVIEWMKFPDKLQNFDVKIPTGFLFAGPPGTGKTFLAKAVAGECGLPFFSVPASELSSTIVGGSSEKIIALFSVARKYAPSIVFIDEIDAIASQRSEDSHGNSRERNAIVNTLLTEMDGFSSSEEPVFVMAATNYPQLLDKAILRPGRFDETIFCDLPNSEARTIFFEKFAQKQNLQWQQSDLTALVSSSQGMSSAEIDQVLREAIYQAVGTEQPLTIEHIKQTIVRVVYGSPSESIKLGKEEKRRTAFHEAAHLLAYKLLFPNQVIDFATIEPRNQSLGFVATRASEEYESYSKIRVMNKLQVLLAGRVAEKLCTNNADDISTGASNDIEKATQLAMHAIYDGGIEESVGPVNVGILTKYEESELLANAQKAVQQWLITAEQNVEQLLNDNYHQLELVANTLLEKESLLSDEINTLFIQ
ncbi:AAA family ATPase [Colwellia sp. BRX9-1]|uniref:AAA family ATPase n=1 Tax=Colwellia sp. BRX9-1 TaxID=2759830 RepID=UPI0015F5F0CF|nr:AAA family ATPase [Colwellia sp. BRX9-1]MBA6352725.1 AAA family ATPase [Colwellia sp. BRX9-1]